MLERVQCGDTVFEVTAAVWEGGREEEPKSVRGPLNSQFMHLGQEMVLRNTCVILATSVSGFVETGHCSYFTCFSFQLDSVMGL